MDDEQVRGYLDRIGADRPAHPDAAALRRLHEAHLAAAPFENLSIHLGEPIELTDDAVLDKIVRRRRGGYCYELNGAFALLLRALGYRVDLLAARVHGRGRFGPPFDHLALLVHLDEPWLVDVGFGRHARHPLRFDHRTEQTDPDGVFVLVDADGGDVDVHQDGKPTYRAERRPRALVDFEPTSWFQQTSPASHFTTGPTCSLPTPDGRVTLAGHRLVTTVGGRRTERLITDDEAFRIYREQFGFELTELPAEPTG